jgi:RNA polymerase-binding transcription factor DksA
MTMLTTPQATPTTFEAFRVLLSDLRADCLRQHEAALAETVTSVPDQVAVSRAATLLQRIEEIDAALDRIDAGTYGRCVHCGETIPEERLEFRPFAAACVSCQQRH